MSKAQYDNRTYATAELAILNWAREHGESVTLTFAGNVFLVGTVLQVDGNHVVIQRGTELIVARRDAVIAVSVIEEAE